MFRSQALLRVAALAGTMALASSCGGGGGGGGGAPPPAPPPALGITTNSLPAGTVGVSYSQTIATSGGSGSRNFTVTSGSLPAGLALTAATGVISGTPAGPAATSNFTVTVTDSGSPQQSDSQAFSLTVNASATGRNDSIATATPLGNTPVGGLAASISPSGHPNTVFSPDQDYYRITTTMTSTVTVDIDAQVNGSPLDSVIEFVNSSGVRLNACVSPGFSSPCLHDDEVLGVERDSLLQVRVAGATTFFVRVLDWRGDARPDMTYVIRISGVN